MRGQFSFPGMRNGTAFGGDLAVGKRKTARPVATKRPMHLCLKSSAATGKSSLLTRPNARKVKRALAIYGTRFQVRVLEQANSGNHLHLLVQTRTRDGFKAFLRSFSGALAMAVTGSRKGQSLEKRFWDRLAFSRIVEWGKDFANVRRYLVMNREEAAGVVPPRWWLSLAPPGGNWTARPDLAAESSLLGFVLVARARFAPGRF